MIILTIMVMSMTLRQSLENAIRLLSESNIADASNDAWILMMEALKIDRTYYYMHGNDTIGENDKAVYDSYVLRRVNREPLQYITEKAYFMGMEFKVTKDVLIPRFDTEILVENALKYIDDNSSVLDMCTGSGCIAISIAKLAHAMVTAVDVSHKALEIAECNRQINEAGNVKLIESNMFEALSDRYDVIVSNPPYIPTNVIHGLEKEVKDNEPWIALDGADDGLRFYRIIAKEAGKYLNDNGVILLEIGCEQAKSVKALLEDNNFTDIQVIKDLAGLNRVICGRRI